MKKWTLEELIRRLPCREALFRKYFNENQEIELTTDELILLLSQHPIKLREKSSGDVKLLSYSYDDITDTFKLVKHPIDKQQNENDSNK